MQLSNLIRSRESETPTPEDNLSGVVLACGRLATYSLRTVASYYLGLAVKNHLDQLNKIAEQAGESRVSPLQAYMAIELDRNSKRLSWSTVKVCFRFATMVSELQVEKFVL